MAAKLQGFAVHFFDWTALHKEQHVNKALEHVPAYTSKTTALLRCPVLYHSFYEKLRAGLLSKNIELLNDTKSYIMGATPYNVFALGELLPKTLLLNKLENEKTAAEKIKAAFLPNTRLMLKDYFSSAKYTREHPWDILNAGDIGSILKGLREFKKQKGLVKGGIVVSEFKELKELVPFALPFSKSQRVYEEYRLFFVDGRLLQVGSYFEELIGADLGNVLSREELETLAKIGARVSRTRFFSLDVARQKDEKITIIETNAGETSGLPIGKYTHDFYKSLAKISDQIR
ncbi:MAG: ATP-grasp domain-containing protein [Bacteroidota bacterium]